MQPTRLAVLSVVLLAAAALASGGQAYAHPNQEGSNVDESADHIGQVIPPIPNSTGNGTVIAPVPDAAGNMTVVKPAPNGTGNGTTPGPVPEVPSNGTTIAPEPDNGGNMTVIPPIPNSTGNRTMPPVTDAPSYTSPVLAHIPDAKVRAGGALEFTIAADNQDSESLAFGLESRPDGATINTITGRFSWTPEAYQTGSHVITVTVSDQNSTDSQSFTVVVQGAARTGYGPWAPDVIASASPNRHKVIRPDIAGTGAAITGVTDTASGDVSFNRGRIMYIPNQTGVDMINYSVSDLEGSTATGTITIFTNELGNARPVLAGIDDTGTNVGRSVNFIADAMDSDDDPLTFDIANVPQGATINATTGYFSWTPISSQNGTHIVTIIVHDDHGGADWQDVTITVLQEGQTNKPPIPENITTIAVVGEAKTFQPLVKDPDGDTVTMRLESPASRGIMLDALISRGIIVYIGTGMGSDEITYTVSDGRGGTSTGTISIVVTEPANINPTLGFIGSKSINAFQPLEFTVTATDIDSTNLTFGLQNAPTGASITPEGDFSWTPTEDWKGRNSFTVIVSDDVGGRDAETVTIHVRDRGFVNAVPTAPDVVDSVAQDTPNIIRPPISDPNDDPVRIASATGNTKGEILTGFLRAGIVIYRPHADQTGIDTITYTVSDGSTQTTTGTITVFINAGGNQNPVLAPIGFRNINAGERLAFDIMARDRDPISYLLAGAPAGAQISEQGAFSWTPTSADEGNHTFAIAVYDDRGGSSSEVVTVRVLPARTPNGAPIAPPVTITVDAGSSAPIRPDIGDPDGDQVSITGSTNPAKGFTIPSDDGILYFSNTGESGIDTIAYTVTDTRGSTATGIITVQINAPMQEIAPFVHETMISTKLTKPSVISKKMADSNNAFAIDLYRRLAFSDNHTGMNIFISPSSVYNSFSLLYEGANENTAAQMQDVFGFESNSTVRYNDTAHTLASINRYDSDTTLRMGNALWLANWFEPYDLYVDTTKFVYATNVQSANFTDPDDSVQRINVWTANKTGGKIDEIITRHDVDDDTSMLLTNAVYFDGTWVTEFPQNNTDRFNFWIDDNSSRKTDFMKVEAIFNYTESAGAQVLKMLHEGNRLSMLIILPQERDGLKALEESISAQQIGNWVHNMENRNVDLSIPRFEIKTNYDLKNTLVSLGVTDVFDKARADLGDIVDVGSSRDLYVSNVIQNAYVKVDEKGAEVAATIDNGVIFDPLLVRFMADHSFIFTIYDEESGMILFMGRITDPTTLEH